MRFHELKTIVYEDWCHHEKDWTRPGFRAVAVHRFGHWASARQSRAARIFCTWCYRRMYRRVRNHYGIELPWRVQLGRGVVIEHQGSIVIHGRSVIGDNCRIRQGVTLGNRYLDKPDDAPVLGCNVNVGAGAKLLGAIKVGDDVNIAANAVVLDDVLSDTSVAGMPARLIADRSQSEGLSARLNPHARGTSSFLGTIDTRND